MTDILAANPDLAGFGIMGGWPLFGAPQPYRDLFKPYADKIASGEFVIGAADTIGDEVAIAKEGLVTALVGQRPFEMGYKAPAVCSRWSRARRSRIRFSSASTSAPRTPSTPASRSSGDAGGARLVGACQFARQEARCDAQQMTLMSTSGAAELQTSRQPPSSCRLVF